MSNTAFVDVGYRFLKYVDANSQIQKLPSVHYELPANLHDIPLNRQSVLIEYQDGTAENLKGTRYVVGAIARDFQYSQATYKYDKVDLIQRLALAAIEPRIKGDSIVIDCLYTSLPEIKSGTIEAIESALVGVHKYKRNRVPLKVEIKSVQISLEGVGAYKWASYKELWQYPQMLNATLDFGGRTLIGQIYSSYGMPIPESRVVLNTGGTYDLANRLAQESDVINSAQGSPKLDIIMDALADGSYRYGQMGASFAHLLLKHQELWLKDSMRELMTRWSPWQNTLAQILLVGGSAVLADPLVQMLPGRVISLATRTKAGTISIDPETDPQTRNLDGMRLFCEPALIAA